MFNEIWKKMKILAKVLFWLVTVLSVILGIVFFVGGGGEGIVMGIVTIIVGILLAWLSAFGIYAFGELIEKVVNINDNVELIVKKVVYNQNIEIQLNNIEVKE